MNKFPCTQCGCCCRQMGKIIKMGIEFPYEVDENGVCEMLTEENKCKVYDNRPDICNISKMAYLLSVDEDEFYKENINECNKMMDMTSISSNYRIIINNK
jgi:Fe-S-cluster containining protein